jgi:hypothetical protein
MRPSLPIVAFACAVWIAPPSDLRAAEDHNFADGIIARSLLERGAFVACAGNEGDKQNVETITRAWKLDLEDSAKVLREAGYADDYIRALGERFSLDKVTPKFDDQAKAALYCAMLGDWRDRMFRLNYMLPQMELSRRLKR